MHRLRSRVLTAAAVFATTAALTVGVAAPADAAPVRTPAGFSPAQLIGPYESDLPPGVTYLPELDSFEKLRAEHPAVMRQNLNTVVRINNAATPAQQRDAIDINYDDRLVSLSYALGDRVGGEFRKLLSAGELPKVAALAEGDLARAGLPMGTTLLEKEVYDNPRPFVVAPKRIKRYDRPGENLYAGLAGNGSYPSGHSAQGYWKGVLLATWLPEIAPQIIARAGDIGRGRIVLGVHYPLDVMGGRIVGQTVAAERLADPGFARLIAEAGTQLRAQLSAALGEPVEQALAADPTVATVADAVADHRADMTYDFDRVFPTMRSTIPASAAVLLKARFPKLSDAQRLDILRRTAVPAGYPLDQRAPDGGWVRIDLAAAYAATP